MRKAIQEADIKKIIKSMQGNFSGSNEEQMKGVQLLKGIATSDDPLSNKFMKALDKATTKISKDVLGTAKESVGRSITVQEDVKINSLIVKAGSKIELIENLQEEEDTRDLFMRNPALLRKADWVEASPAKLTPSQEEALKDIVSGGRYVALGKRVNPFSSIFNTGSDTMEYVVSVPEYGYFYVDTEGFDYARYIMRLPDEFVRKELMPLL